MPHVAPTSWATSGAPMVRTACALRLNITLKQNRRFAASKTLRDSLSTDTDLAWQLRLHRRVNVRKSAL